ncbi:simple sugar transport system permease protein [Streptosporangium becharense]|uniref:Simple sugar transport system permease protein n=1 Tax=Streptosporangium becharense TaxID=1816182 RepID=A0A7W9MJB4_9ACTN|nr:ABC transporter permease [Streptosporangium becharense]MBB2911691.1 simple sugar transport system permease protein [Streptosporangium becharense]MBB5822491.1 simple sugar transport system permease protein [Streptosporangium becharense]
MRPARAPGRGVPGTLAVPALALLIALTVTAALLAAVGASPGRTYLTMLEFGLRPDSLVSAVNRSTIYFFAGLAVAVAFRMNLFNIGVEGQYRIAALLAAAAGAAVDLPGPLHLTVVCLVAMLTGAVWAGIAAVLRTWRGVSEVLSTLLLNYVATAVIAYLLAEVFAADSVTGSTPELPPSARLPVLDGLPALFGLPLPAGVHLGGAALGAVVFGVVVHWVLTRTLYGHDLKISGLNPTAARAHGIDPRRMILITMLVSGGLAGLAGLPDLLGNTYRYGMDFPSGAGFTGIAVALLGRNTPLGIALSALLFGFLERSALILDIQGIPKEIVTIMQGVIVISVVVAHEVVRRMERRRTARLVREGTSPAASEPAGPAA